MNSLSLYLGNVEKFNTNSSVRGDAVSSAGYETRKREGVFSPDLEAVKYVPGEAISRSFVLQYSGEKGREAMV